MQANWQLLRPLKRKVFETTEKEEAERFAKQGYSVRHLADGRYRVQKRLAKWEYFQERVKLLLQALGFEDVESGQASWLGRYQIDVVGGYDGTLLIFECKSADQPKLKKLTKEINIFAGKKAEIEQAVREKFKAKYNEVKYILAVDHLEFSTEDLVTAHEGGVYIWANNYLKAADDLYSMVGPLLTHYVLKELGVGPKLVRDDEGGADYKVPCFRLVVGNQQIFSFYMPAEKLLNLVYVFRLQPGNEEAYQRILSRRRILGSSDEPGITEFINNGGFFKSSVVCTFERPVHFEPRPTGLLLNQDAPQFGILSIPKLYGTVWVIDGQHRIYGYAGATPDSKRTALNVVAYQDLDKREQARDFVNINQKHQPVDPNTLWELLAQTDPHSLNGAIPRLVELLSRRGMFKGKVFFPARAFQRSRATFPFKLASLCNSLYDLKLLDNRGRDNLYKATGDVSASVLYPDSVIEYAVDAIDEYFSIVWEASARFPEWRKGFILQNNGINVFLRVLVELLRFQEGRWNRQAAKELLEAPFGAYFEEEFERIGEIRTTHTSNEAGRARIALEMLKHINRTNAVFAREMIEEAEKRERAVFEKSEPYQILRGLENGIREFIVSTLEELDGEWWKRRVPDDIQSKALERSHGNESPWPWLPPGEAPPIFYVDFPDYAKIILRSDNWRDAFQAAFRDREWISSRFRELQEIRNKIAHYRNLSAQESTALRLYADQILKAIQSRANRAASS